MTRVVKLKEIKTKTSNTKRERFSAYCHIRQHTAIKKKDKRADRQSSLQLESMLVKHEYDININVMTIFVWLLKKQNSEIQMEWNRVY